MVSWDQVAISAGLSIVGSLAAAYVLFERRLVAIETTLNIHPPSRLHDELRDLRYEVRALEPVASLLRSAAERSATEQFGGLKRE